MSTIISRTIGNALTPQLGEIAENAKGPFTEALFEEQFKALLKIAEGFHELALKGDLNAAKFTSEILELLSGEFYLQTELKDRLYMQGLFLASCKEKEFLATKLKRFRDRGASGLEDFDTGYNSIKARFRERVYNPAHQNREALNKVDIQTASFLSTVDRAFTTMDSLVLQRGALELVRPFLSLEKEKPNFLTRIIKGETGSEAEKYVKTLMKTEYLYLSHSVDALEKLPKTGEDIPYVKTPKQETGSLSETETSSSFGSGVSTVRSAVGSAFGSLWNLGKSAFSTAATVSTTVLPKIPEAIKLMWSVPGQVDVKDIFHKTHVKLAEFTFDIFTDMRKSLDTIVEILNKSGLKTTVGSATSKLYEGILLQTHLLKLKLATLNQEKDTLKAMKSHVDIGEISSDEYNVELRKFEEKQLKLYQEMRVKLTEMTDPQKSELELEVADLNTISPHLGSLMAVLRNSIIQINTLEYGTQLVEGSYDQFTKFQKQKRTVAETLEGPPKEGFFKGEQVLKYVSEIVEITDALTDAKDNVEHFKEKLPKSLAEEIAYRKANPDQKPRDPRLLLNYPRTATMPPSTTPVTSKVGVSVNANAMPAPPVQTKLSDKPTGSPIHTKK